MASKQSNLSVRKRRYGFTQHNLKERQATACPVAAIELAMRQPGTPLFNSSAPGFRQQALLK